MRLRWLESARVGTLRFCRPRSMRRVLSTLLAVTLALPVGDVRSAPSLGTIQGVVRLAGRPLAGVTVAFIDLLSGAVVRATSHDDGAFEVKAPVGEYAVTTENQPGLTVVQAPVRVAVAEDRVASADVDLASVPSAVEAEAAPAGAAATQEPPASAPPAEGGASQAQEGPVYAETTGSGAQIQFEPVTCFVAGEFPLLDASIEPMASVARARLYFRAAGGSSFYYVEMSPDRGRFYGKLPRPRIEASPITYYLQSTTTEFEESQTREIDAIVVERKEDCEGRKVAAYGPEGPVVVFSAQTGASVLPTGFAAAASGIAAGTIAILAAAAAAAGIVGGVVVAPGPGGSGTPPPIGTPSPIPIPTPLPSGTPPPPVTTSR
jgi:hypothetical protein